MDDRALRPRARLLRHRRAGGTPGRLPHLTRGRAALRRGDRPGARCLVGRARIDPTPTSWSTPGPGTGTLARRRAGGPHPRCAPALHYVLVERSPMLRDRHGAPPGPRPAGGLARRARGRRWSGRDVARRDAGHLLHWGGPGQRAARQPGRGPRRPHRGRLGRAPDRCRRHRDPAWSATRCPPRGPSPTPPTGSHPTPQWVGSCRCNERRGSGCATLSTCSIAAR
jgi:hypothetical protein